VKKAAQPLFKVAGFASRPLSSQAAKPAKNENHTVFIRSDAHAVRAEFKVKGRDP